MINTKASDICPTPSWIMNMFEDFYDPCPLNPKIDGLKTEWKDKTFVNPPYSNPLVWVLKAIEESKKGKYIVLLLRMDCSVKYFRFLMEAGAKILFINCRVKFKGMGFPPFSNALFILENTKGVVRAK
jgi:hypothetical protein